MNRARPAGEHIVDSWWRGVYILFAQITGDLEWFIAYLAAQRRLGRARKTVHEMIRRRPISEQARLFNSSDYKAALSQRMDDFDDAEVRALAEAAEEEADYYR